jgi:hypothetical protein
MVVQPASTLLPTTLSSFALIGEKGGNEMACVSDSTHHVLRFDFITYSSSGPLG